MSAWSVLEAVGEGWRWVLAWGMGAWFAYWLFRAFLLINRVNDKTELRESDRPLTLTGWRK